MKHLRSALVASATLTRLAAAIFALACGAPIVLSAAAAEPQTRLQAGVLECRGEGGWGIIIASKKTFECVFSNLEGQPIGRYEAVVRKFGIDLGVSGATALQWAVFGPASRVGGQYVAGSLEGEYAGVGADVSLGPGLGANALIGGGTESLALQPVSVQAGSGVNIAAGVRTLVLTYTGPAS
jgi:hypothetical protein